MFVFTAVLRRAHYLSAPLGALALFFLAQALLINILKDLPGRFQFQTTVMGADTKLEYDGQQRQLSESICTQPGSSDVE